MSHLAYRLNKQDQEAEVKLFGLILFLLALVVGILVRWNFISHTKFPINDGGFFYQMIVELMNNHFKLPEFSGYNHANIPFAYPPMGFYVTGAIHKITGVNVLTLLHYLPFLFSVFTIPVFYLFTKNFFDGNWVSRGMATLFYATLPRSFEWLVMGGGITRVLGLLFALIACIFSARVFDEKGNWIDALLASAFIGLTVLSHPVASLFLVFSLGVLFVYYWPVRLFKVIVMAIIAISISAPWWINVLTVHGVSPFIGATNTGHMDWFEAKYLLTLNFEYENRHFLPVVSFLALLGLFHKPRRQAIFLGMLVGLGYLIIPRGGVDLLTVYLAMLAAFGMEWVVKNISHITQQDGDGNWNEYIQSLGSKIWLIFIVVYTFSGAYTYKYVDGKVELHIDEENIAAMTWLREETNQDSKIIVLPSDESHRNWPNDYLGEWLPAISGRESLATVQGYEWMPDKFSGRVNNYLHLRSCVSTGIECIENWQNQNECSADYIYLGNISEAELISVSYTHLTLPTN